MLKKTVLGCTLLLLIAGVNAQWPSTPIFHQLDVKQLGFKSAGGQTWDTTGRLWLITDQGLACYDGFHARVIAADSQNVHTPLSDQISLIAQTGPDEFWLTYKDNPAKSMFSPIQGEFKHFFPDSLNPHSINAAPATKIIPHNDSIVFLMTWGGGLCRLNKQSGYAVSYFNPDPVQYKPGLIASNYTKDMCLMPDGTYFITFFEEQWHSHPQWFDPQNGNFRDFDLESYTVIGSERTRTIILRNLEIINFVHLEGSDRLWVGTYSGLVLIDLKAKTARRVSAPENDLDRQNLENARNYAVDERGFLWIGTPNQGVIQVNPKTEEARYVSHDPYNNNSLDDNRLSTINKDPFGNIWISTKSGSFSIYSPILQSFQTHTWQSMNLDFEDRSRQTVPVNQMLILPNGTALISNQTGLILYNPVTHEDRLLVKSEILAPAKSGETAIGNFKKVGDWIYFVIVKKPKTTKHFAFRYNLLTTKLEVLNTELPVKKMLFRHGPEDSPVVMVNDGFTNSFFYNYDPLTNQMEEIFRCTTTVYQFEQVFSILLEDGRWMLPDNKGKLHIFDPVSREITNLNEQKVFEDSTVKCAYHDKSGGVWVGTQKGVYFFDESETKFTNRNNDLHLKGEVEVNSICQDLEGIYWFALKKELLRWDPVSGETFLYDQSLGLNSGEFLPSVAQLDASGKIYMASINGIVIFDPSEIEIPSNKFTLYFSRARLFDQYLPEESSGNFEQGLAEFAYDENFLKFEFHTNQVYAIEPHNFYYRISGKDTSWQKNGNSNEIRLSDLKSGDYSIEVKAINKLGHESNVITLKFKILKPFWLTWWFYAIIIVVAGLIVFYYIKYRERALRKRSLELEQTVAERTADVVREKKEADKQRLEAEHQKEIVEEKQKEITDSINYARRIQNAILPSNRFFRENLPDSFILYLPKDVVAGDFYFLETLGDHIIVAVADCTGHGVPGAMVSVVCHNALTRSIKEFGYTDSDQILNKTRDLVLETFAKSEDQVNDGMDISICTINRKTGILKHSGANNGLFLLRNNELLEYKADKQPIGKFLNPKPFTRQEIKIEQGDFFYLFSDGYADQFGGEEGKPGGKKFKYSRLKTLLTEIHHKSVDEQKNVLNETLTLWRGDLEQIDDVCIIGFSI